MATIKVTLTEDMLQLIPNFALMNWNFKQAYEEEGSDTVCLDMNGLYGGSYVFEDMSRILGIYDHHIEGTEEDPLGVQFPKEDEDMMWEMHGYIVENLLNIEEIIHQFCVKGGVKPGTYTAKNNEHIWQFEG